MHNCILCITIVTVNYEVFVKVYNWLNENLPESCNDFTMCF